MSFVIDVVEFPANDLSMRMVNVIGRGGVVALVSCLAVVKTPAQPPSETSSKTDYTVIWKSVEADDYRTYVANLQAIGCPAQTMQDIVTGELSRSFDADSRAALEEFYARRPYWKCDTNLAAAASQLEERRAALTDEVTSTLQTLFGTEVSLPDLAGRWQRAELEAKLAFLSAEKRGKVESILESHAVVDQRAKSLSEATLVSNDSKELARIAAGHAEGRTLLLEALTADEFERVEIVASWTGDNLRQAMSHFDPTEAEFRMIFAPWRAHDEELVGTYAAREPDPGNAGVHAKIQEQMTPERYAEYLRTWWK